MLVKIIMFLMLFLSECWATNYFVSATGSDSNNCLSSGAACLTIAHAESLSAAGDTINIAAGTYRLSTSNSSNAGLISAKNNQIFTGPACTPTIGPTQCTAIISGGMLIGASATGPDGNGNWSVTGQTQAGGVNTAPCDTGWDGCNYPEDLFIDGVPQQHIKSVALPTLAVGQWWFDYTSNKIYFHQNPSGHIVETSVLETMFANNGANGVTVENLTIEEFAAQIGQGGGIDSTYGGTASSSTGINWTVQNCYITLNHSEGVRGSFGIQILNNVLTNNGEFGAGGGIPTGVGITPSGLVVQGNTVTNNNYAHVSPGFGAGGLKFSNAANAVIRNNIVNNNLGNGIHFDQNSVNPLIDNNSLTGNLDTAATGGSGTGLICEIGELGCTIRNNFVDFEGTGGAFGMVSSTNSGAQMYCNVIEEVATGTNELWAVIASNRGNNTAPPNNGAQIVSTGNNVLYNTLIWDTGATGNVGYTQLDTTNQPNFFADNTAPDHNFYHASSTAVSRFIYDNDNSGSNTVKTFASYQSAGADVHGTFDTVNTSGFPTVSITSPADQSTFSGSTTVSATASDGSGISKVELYSDWTLKQTITSGPFNFTLSGVSNGAHVVAALAYAVSGVKACFAVTLTNSAATPAFQDLLLMGVGY